VLGLYSYILFTQTLPRPSWNASGNQLATNLQANFFNTNDEDLSSFFCCGQR
jgi:hypothetical protein